MKPVRLQLPFALSENFTKINTILITRLKYVRVTSQLEKNMLIAKEEIKANKLDLACRDETGVFSYCTSLSFL